MSDPIGLDVEHMTARYLAAINRVLAYIDLIRATRANTRRTHMHTAYRAKTRRRNRRTK